MRVLAWALERVEGKGKGVDHVFGTSPSYDDISWDGLEFSKEQFDSITAIDKAAWLEELNLHAELFEKLKHNLPAQLEETKAQIASRLAA